MILKEKSRAFRHCASINHTAVQPCDRVSLSEALGPRLHQTPLTTTFSIRRESLVRLRARCGGSGPMTNFTDLEYTLPAARDRGPGFRRQRLAAALVLAMGLVGSPALSANELPTLTTNPSSDRVSQAAVDQIAEAAKQASEYDLVTVKEKITLPEQQIIRKKITLPDQQVVREKITAPEAVTAAEKATASEPDTKAKKLTATEPDTKPEKATVEESDTKAKKIAAAEPDTNAEKIAAQEPATAGGKIKVHMPPPERIAPLLERTQFDYPAYKRYVKEQKEAKIRAQTQYLAAKFGGSESNIRKYVELAWKEASQREGLPPELLIAVMQKESSLQPKVQSNYGAQGLMQVVRRWHHDKLQPSESLFDPAVNIRVGADVLEEYLEKANGSLAKALKQYSGNAQGYATKVLNESYKLARVAAEAARDVLASKG